MNWYLQALKKYAIFGGRAQRKEYWFFALINLLFSIGFGIIDFYIRTYNPETGIGFLGAIYALGVLVPGIAVTVRRLHDTDHSGWSLLLLLFPVIGGLVILFFLVSESDPSENQYGLSPKAYLGDSLAVVSSGTPEDAR